jgi:hypothetical protein
MGHARFRIHAPGHSWRTKGPRDRPREALMTPEVESLDRRLRVALRQNEILAANALKFKKARNRAQSISDRALNHLDGLLSVIERCGVGLPQEILACAERAETFVIALRGELEDE